LSKHQENDIESLLKMKSNARKAMFRKKCTAPDLQALNSFVFLQHQMN